MIKDITITIGKKDIKLSMKEVKQLRKELNDLVETETVKEFISYPVYPIRPYGQLWYDSPTVTCGSGAIIDRTYSNDTFTDGIQATFTSKN